MESWEVFELLQKWKVSAARREWSNQKESSAYTNLIDDLSNILSFLHCPSLTQYRPSFPFEPSQANLDFCSCRPTISSTSANFLFLSVSCLCDIRRLNYLSPHEHEDVAKSFQCCQVVEEKRRPGTWTAKSMPRQYAAVGFFDTKSYCRA